jgi:hypothetical protein
MDCEKYDSLIIDELYDELDELTSAAMKRHASGCPRCASKMVGLKTTRELSKLAEPDFPPGLEERILSAAREAEKVVPIGRSRLSRAVSFAGTWAMRPQTAMAALFLLMIGSSAVLLRSRQPKESAALTVTQEGAPSPAAAADDREESKSAFGGSNAHGAVAAAPTMTAAASAAPAPLALAEPRGASAGKAELDDPSAPRDSKEAKKDKDDLGRAGPGGGLSGTLALGGGASNGYAPAQEAPATPPAPPAAAPMAAAKGAEQNQARARDGSGDAFTAGMAAYQARQYADATRKLDEAASLGNPAAALWAARSVREGSGCAAAVPRFNAVAAKGGSTGADATFDAARCYDALGDRNAAKARYTALLSNPTYGARAQAALDSSSEMASRKASAPSSSSNGDQQQQGASTGGARAAPAKNAAPKPAAAPPANVDRANAL